VTYLAHGPALSQDMKAVVHKLQPLRHATRLEATVEGLKLQLLATVEPPETMVTAAISDLTLALSRNQDLSGEQGARTQAGFARCTAT
jgi:uncharacterized protein YqhQ